MIEIYQKWQKVFLSIADNDVLRFNELKRMETVDFLTLYDSRIKSIEAYNSRIKQQNR